MTDITPTPAPSDTTTTDERPEWLKRLSTLRNRLPHLSPGDRAQLRRLAHEPASPAFYKLLAEIAPDLLTYQPRDEDDAKRHDGRVARWQALVAATAIVADVPGRPLFVGTSLAEAGFAEGRLTRLLRADAERLPGRIVDAARYLAAKGVATNTEDFGRLLFSRRDDLARRRIAAAYFRHLHAKS